MSSVRGRLFFASVSVCQTPLIPARENLPQNYWRLTDPSQRVGEDDEGVHAAHEQHAEPRRYSAREPQERTWGQG